MPKRPGDRFFVVNRYQGKNGPRSSAAEHSTHESATAAACWAVMEWARLTGVEPGDQAERFEVFVGSKTNLDSILGREMAQSMTGRMNTTPGRTE